MRPAREYVEVLERDQKDVSTLWRIVQMMLCLASAASGYVGAILFYIFWQNIFDGQCPLWASVAALPKNARGLDEDYDDEEDANGRFNSSDWRLDVVVSHHYNLRCNVYFVAMLCSCFFGTVWLTFFYICGRGELLVAPWRIVAPAFAFNIIFSIATLYFAYQITKGYETFSDELEKLYWQLTKTEMLRSYRKCDIVQSYVEAYKNDKYNVCARATYIEILAWIIGGSWTGGTFVLLLRIMCAADFRILRVTVYNVPREIPASASNDE